MTQFFIFFFLFIELPLLGNGISGYFIVCVSEGAAHLVLAEIPAMRLISQSRISLLWMFIESLRNQTLRIANKLSTIVEFTNSSRPYIWQSIFIRPQYHIVISTSCNWLSKCRIFWLYFSCNLWINILCLVHHLFHFWL